MLVRNNRFFSMFDRRARVTMYNHCKVVRFSGKGSLVEEDSEDTDHIQIILKGRVNQIHYSGNLNIEMDLGYLCEGEVVGDSSIQRKYFDVLKILSKDRKYVVTETEETAVAKIRKDDFIKCVFKEMQQDLFYKIILLRNTPYFKELSPYSLVILASNIEVREVKYGSVVLTQGQMPDALYILAYGNLKTVYTYADQKSTKVSRYAKKVLRTDIKRPLEFGQICYQNLPRDQCRKVQEIKLKKVQDMMTKIEKVQKGKKLAEESALDFENDKPKIEIYGEGEQATELKHQQKRATSNTNNDILLESLGEE